jgi:hypothetical protein
MYFEANLTFKFQVTRTFGIAVNDFGKSWRDGNAFLAICSSIKPGIEVETPMYTGELIK